MGFLRDLDRAAEPLLKALGLDKPSRNESSPSRSERERSAFSKRLAE
jgi:hypothetical protein